MEAPVIGSMIAFAKWWIVATSLEAPSFCAQWSCQVGYRWLGAVVVGITLGDAAGLVRGGVVVVSTLGAVPMASFWVVETVRRVV